MKKTKDIDLSVEEMELFGYLYYLKKHVSYVNFFNSFYGEKNNHHIDYQYVKKYLCLPGIELFLCTDLLEKSIEYFEKNGGIFTVLNRVKVLCDKLNALISYDFFNSHYADIIFQFGISNPGKPFSCRMVYDDSGLDLGFVDEEKSDNEHICLMDLD